MTTNLAHHLTAVEVDEPAPDFSYSVEPAQSYAEEPSVCAFCHGAGMEVMPGNGARRWRCRSEDGRSKLMEAVCIPRRYSECSLQSYLPAKGNSSQLLAFNCAFSLVREYSAVDRGLVFMGIVGVGKTHLGRNPARSN
jgi:DNA replication protein DnaC